MNFNLFLSLLINILLIINSQLQDDIIVYPTNNNIIHSCSNDVYQFQFDVTFSNKFNEIIPFELVLPFPNNFPFKCILDGPKSNIACFHSFSNYVWTLPNNSKIELPYSFPEIEGIRWDYDSFLKKISRNLWRNDRPCGLIHIFDSNNNKVNSQESNKENNIKEIKTEMTVDIEEITGGECHSSKNDYRFDMKLKLIEGQLFEEMKKSKENNKTIEISFLHSIYMPILIGDKTQKGITIFTKNYEYKYAKCYRELGITKVNFDSNEGVYFICHLTINKYYNFKGPVQIKPFTDYVYIKKTDADGKIDISKVGIKFEILSGFEISDSNNIVNSNNLQYAGTPAEKLIGEKISNIKEPNFLILDSKLNTFICPDTPILTIKNYNEGIQFGGLNRSGNKYLFLMYGYLSNGFEYLNDTISLLDMTKDEIRFRLKVTDNLKNYENRRNTIKCYIPTGSSINKNELIEVKCIGDRIPLFHNNTDIILNWNIEENNSLKNIVVRWPYDLTKRKHIFYYEIQGLSVKKDNFGCFENKYYFFLYVFDLKSEPKISFNLPLISPKNSHAICKLYNSVTFKCIIDLRLKRLFKGEKIILPSNFSGYLPNNENNYVLYKVDDKAISSPLDFQLTVEENCGDFKLIGALKDIGYTYLQALIIIICIIVFLMLCTFCIVFVIIYEIKHRNQKGFYFKHLDEKSIPNISTNSIVKK